MKALAPTLQAFFCERLLTQRRASPHTVSAYRDTFCLLLGFAQERTGKAPATLEVDDLDATTICAFLDHLERARSNSVRTRNARLAAIHSLFRFAALRHPECASVIQQVLAVPPKRFERGVVSFLTDDEVEALIAAPDRTSILGRRDHALLVVAVQTGLRSSEITGLKRRDVVLGSGAHLHCLGKGRKERATPLTRSTSGVLKAWLAETGGRDTDPLFPGRQRSPLSRYGVADLVARHARSAARSCPSLKTKRISPHVLRHTAAMRLLRAGVDTSVIALWLGHERVETTQIYVHADLTIKERALAKTAPISTPQGRYRPPDQLLAFLESL